MKMLAGAGVRYCVGLHDRIARGRTPGDGIAGAGPPVAPGPLVVRWNLASRLPLPGRQVALRAVRPAGRRRPRDPARPGAHGRPGPSSPGARVWITANNKAEGSACFRSCKLAEEIARSRKSGSGSLQRRPDHHRGALIERRARQEKGRCPLEDPLHGPATSAAAGNARGPSQGLAQVPTKRLRPAARRICPFQSISAWRAARTVNGALRAIATSAISTAAARRLSCGTTALT